MAVLHPIPPLWQPIVDETIGKMQEIEPDLLVLEVGRRYGQLALRTTNAANPEIRKLKMQAERKCAATY